MLLARCDRGPVIDDLPNFSRCSREAVCWPRWRLSNAAGVVNGAEGDPDGAAHCREEYLAKRRLVLLYTGARATIVAEIKLACRRKRRTALAYRISSKTVASRSSGT